jgi:hypothetical protein
MRIPGLIAICALLSATAAPAETLVAAHAGSADPVTEGWMLDFPGVSTTSGPLNDGGTPVWFIDDASLDLNSARWYRVQLAPAQLTAANASGWRLRLELRPLNAAGQGETQFFGFLSGAVAFQIHFNAETNGDVTVRVVESYPPFAGPTYTIPGGALAYHVYELRSDGASGTASLWIDDVLVHSGYDGFPYAVPNGARWGCGTSAAVGTVYVKSVEFWIADVAVSVDTAVEAASWGRVKAGFQR